jgi:phosphopantothenoylcysteine decarboxylase/phosphopantothenate--cysteine ligase
LIGFAAETENLRQEARRKLEAKGCDMIVGNLVGQPEGGFESDQNEVTLAMRDGLFLDIPRASKRVIADRILDQVMRLRVALQAM